MKTDIKLWQSLLIMLVAFVAGILIGACQLLVR